MASLKSLAKDTAIYGMSSILGRFLNYLLTPVYTHVIDASTGGYGIVTEMYAYTALILVILTFGMETTFFRFANDEKIDHHTVFSTSFAMVAVLSFGFLGAVCGFIDPISEWMGYPDHKNYILLMACVVALDALQAVPFSLLRYRMKSGKFAMLKFAFIVLNVGLNLLYFCVLGYTDVFYVFALNLVCTAIIGLAFIPELCGIRWKVDLKLLGRMLNYSWPMLLLGIAGILNHSVDKMIFKHVYPDPVEGTVQLGIYGACVKVAMIMSMLMQAFRYAYEPIVFAANSGKGSEVEKKRYYANAMKFFLIFALLAFLGVMSCIEILAYIIDTDYREGLVVVPIVMTSEILLGVYFNLSFWYKLTDETYWGAIFSFIGCAVVIAFNLLLIPAYGYMACAWGGVAGYLVCMLASYVMGQIKNPIPYDLASIFRYVALAAGLYLCMELLPIDGLWAVPVKLLLVCVYVIYMLKKDFPIGSLLSKLRSKR